jgi:5,6-dimethylbenzimidazole synthase
VPLSQTKIKAMDLPEAISKRRDTRHFLTDTVDFSIIEEAINIANTAPSVGQLKPTGYVVITDLEIKKKIKANFETVNNPAKKSDKSDEKEAVYNQLKLEGILEASIGIVTCCDFSVLDVFTIGTLTQPKEMLLAGTSCAIHTLWLYLTACNLAMGRVNFGFCGVVKNTRFTFRPVSDGIFLNRKTRDKLR